VSWQTTSHDIGPSHDVQLPASQVQSLPVQRLVPQAKRVPNSCCSTMPPPGALEVEALDGFAVQVELFGQGLRFMSSSPDESATPCRRVVDG
jgi:hypothetical protein